MNKSTTYQNSRDSRTAQLYIGNYNEKFADVLAARESLGKEKQKLWIKLQRSYFEEGMVLQEFLAVEEESNHWRIFLGLTAQRSLKGGIGRKAQKVSPDGVNEQLYGCYTDGNQDTSERFWLELEKQINFSGYYIPMADLARLSRQTIKDALEWRTELSNHFDILGFLKSLKHAQNDFEDVELPILGFWTYLRVYAKALDDIYNKSGQTVGSIVWISDAIENLNELSLPSTEVMQLLFRLVEQKFRLEESLSMYQSRWEKFSKETHAFYAENNVAIEKFLLSNSAAYSNSEFLLLKDAFINLCAKDREYMQVQELLDDHSGENVIGRMSADFKELFGPNKRRSVSDRMRNVIGGISIVDRIKGMSSEEIPEAYPAIGPEVIEVISEGAQRWSEYTPSELAEIHRHIHTDLSPSDYKRLNEIAKKRCTAHLQNLANIITAPVVVWVNEKDKVVPQFNVLSNKRAEQYAEYFWRRQSQEDEDRALFNDLLMKIKEFDYPSEVSRFAKNAPSFKLNHIAEEWEVAWKDYKEALSNRLKYRSGRMREFGIHQSPDYSDKKRDIWLDEMLKIEEEVKPYIGFVKKAFAAALPVRQKVDFDPYRHKSDGVEFDPETIMDQNKWLRGDIMKSLRFETSVGKIEQINSFCLDFSSSMDHDRMRGLFKILYLLVLGLEDRKTYDAIHFFGTSFISTSPFRTGYTDRSMLFNILRKIGRIKKDGVLYRGLGGTNISEGIRMCHMEIENFNQHLLRQNPNTNLASSLFVLTDGEPTVGMVNNEELHDFIEDLRENSNVIIKGIYLNPRNETTGFIQQIFGDEHYIETHTFKDTVNAFVSLMTKTYKQQRKDYRWKQKKRKIEGE